MITFGALTFSFCFNIDSVGDFVEGLIALRLDLIEYLS